MAVQIVAILDVLNHTN